MTEGLYSKKVLALFKHPKNMGSIKDADGIGEVGNIICGDVMKLYIKVKNERIKDIKVETYGCVAAVSSSSLLTELVKGKTLDQALKVTKQDIVEKLGGLPPHKLHCSVLAVDALKKAIEDYRAKKK